MKDTLQNAALKLRIDQLQHQIDSLKGTQITDKLQFQVERESEIISQVNDLYMGIFGILGLLIGLIAIALPYYINWLQKKDLKFLKDKTVQEVKDRFEIQINEISNTNSLELQTLNSSFQEKSQELEALVNRKFLVQSGLSYLMKGINDSQNKRFDLSLYHMFFSIVFYLRADEPNEIKASLKNIGLVLGEIFDKNYIISARQMLIAYKEKFEMNKIIEELSGNNNLDIYKVELDITIKELERIDNLKNK